MLEADIKRKLVEVMRREGGYARRIEDKFAVGFPDLILIPIGCPVLFVEVKLIKSGWKATERQEEELKRIREATQTREMPHAIPCELGYSPDPLDNKRHLLKIRQPWNRSNDWNHVFPNFAQLRLSEYLRGAIEQWGFKYGR